MADLPPPTGIDGEAAHNGGADIDDELVRLIHEHHAPLYRYAFRLCGNAADAEDLVQQTFVVAQEKLHQLRQTERSRSWLFTVLRNGFLKSRRKNRPISAESLDLDMESVSEPAPSDDEIDRERLQLVLDALPDEHRLVLVMFYFEEYSYREIAAKLDVPIGTVMSRLSRAKQRLRCGLLAGDEFRASDADDDKQRIGSLNSAKDAPVGKDLSRPVTSGLRNAGK
jgi:RNA polymerase sigma-70 factor (ECF subfamily)